MALLRASMQYIQSTKGYIWFVRLGKRVGWWKFSAVGGLVLGIGITLLAGGGPVSISEVPQAPRAVSIASVGEISGQTTSLPVVGTVESQSQAEVRTESAGQIVHLYRQLGDTVRAGEVIAEMENSRERAAVLQSEGSLDAAKAVLAKISRGARDEQIAILEANVTSSQTAEIAARTSAVNTLLSAYATVDESIRRKTDPLFSNPSTNAPVLQILTTDSSLESETKAARLDLGATLARQDALSATLSSDTDLAAELTRTETEVRAVKNYLDKIVNVLNKAIPDQAVSSATIASYKIDANAARASISATLTSLTNARETLSAKAAARQVAEKNLEQGAVSDASDIASAEASVKQAQGGLAGARASLEKTIIRAPISGTINSLPLNQGDFVSAFAPAVTIANNKALEILAYITETDAQELFVGSVARIDNTFEGVITRIAPVADPSTKKLEVRIGISNETPLKNGQAVTVELARSSATTVAANRPITIPISALKIGSSAIVVFTVDAEGVLQSHEVKLGTLLGDRVVIAEGLTSDMKIVLDARGLKAGQKVSVK